MYVSARPALLGSAFLLAALPAAASDEAVAPAAAPAPRATVNYPGISSVPMTADAARRPGAAVPSRAKPFLRRIGRHSLR